MQFQGTVIKSQGVTFALVVVREHVIADEWEANNFIKSVQTTFPNMPIVLMAQNTKGTPAYYGRRDIVDFMGTVNLESIHFKIYTK